MIDCNSDLLRSAKVLLFREAGVAAEKEELLISEICFYFVLQPLKKKKSSWLGGEETLKSLNFSVVGSPNFICTKERILIICWLKHLSFDPQ